MKKILNVLIVGIFTLVLFSVAEAVPLIDLSGVGIGGSITVSGGNASGAGIVIDTLFADETPLNSGYHEVVDGRLSFDTSSDFIKVEGAIPTLGISDGVLLDGSFSSFEILGTAVYGSGPDTKSLELLGALGLSLDTTFEFFGFSIYQYRSNNRLFTSTDIVNTAKVPEPGTLLLLGSGLLGIALYRRKNEIA